MPTTKFVGVRITINYENIYPFVDTFGMNFDVGRDYNIKMKLVLF